MLLEHNQIQVQAQQLRSLGAVWPFFPRAGTTALPTAGQLGGTEQTYQHTRTGQNQEQRAVIVRPHAKIINKL